MKRDGRSPRGRRDGPRGQFVAKGDLGRERVSPSPTERLGAPADRDWVAGFHAVEAIFERSPERLRKLFCVASTDGAGATTDSRSANLQARARSAGIHVEWATRDQLNQMAETLVDGEQGGLRLRHQGVIAEVEVPRALTERALERCIVGARLVLVLDGVTDPHNLGACLRSAAAAGAAAVIQPRDHSAPLNAIARRAAAGAAERVPLLAVSNLARTLLTLRNEGFWSVGLDGAAESSLYALDWPERVVVVMGDEGRGLRARTRELCDFLVAIPMSSGVESLNVSVATGVTLFEWRRKLMLSETGVAIEPVETAGGGS
ncbi:MAG: 23S rRNA (guanosine(2251)-2'-O)-methyltransferase RlmB [Thioalkalivibrionaceae bacterium]